MVENNVALYLDFENLAVSADETYPSKEKPLLIEPIVDFAANKGNICVKKSYADWTRNIYRQYQKYLLEHGFEMIYLPATSFQGKNGSDVRMAIDIMENMELFKTIDTFIIGSGDTDFIPLTQKMLSRGKKVIILGFDNSVGRLVKNNCTEFKSLDELLSYPEVEQETERDIEQETETIIEQNNKISTLVKSSKPNPGTNSSFQLGQATKVDTDTKSGRDLLARYIKTKSNEEPISMSQLKMDLLRLQPSFSEKKHGHSSFKKFVLSLVGDVVDKVVPDENGDPVVHLKEYSEIEVTPLNLDEEVEKYLRVAFKFQKNPGTRSKICKRIFKYFKNCEAASLSELTEHLFNFNDFSKTTIRKFIHTLASAKVFEFTENESQGPLLSRRQRLNESINSYEMIEKMYMKYIEEKIADQFPDLEDDHIIPLMS